jgi:hypothetical protein
MLVRCVVLHKVHKQPNKGYERRFKGFEWWLVGWLTAQSNLTYKRRKPCVKK